MNRISIIYRNILILYINTCTFLKSYRIPVMTMDDNIIIKHLLVHQLLNNLIYINNYYTV